MSSKRYHRFVSQQEFLHMPSWCLNLFGYRYFCNNDNFHDVFAGQIARYGVIYDRTVNV